MAGDRILGLALLVAAVVLGVRLVMATRRHRRYMRELQAMIEEIEASKARQAMRPRQQGDGET